MGADFVITALSGGYKADEGILVLGAVPFVLRQELKSSRALKKIIYSLQLAALVWS